MQQTDVGDEFVVSWYPPEYGIETLRVYVVRWYREPGHHLIGTAETRDTYYKGIFFIHFLFLSHLSRAHSSLLLISLFLLTVRYLMENELYTFQVFSLSTTDYQAGSNEYDIRVPAYRIKMRLVAIIITLIILSMLVFAAIYIYLKKRCADPYPDNDEKLQKP